MPAKNLRLTLVQSPLQWEKPDTNRMHFIKVLKGLRKGATDLIVLPEMFTTGFTMNASEVAESMHGETIAWMHELANAKNAAVCGSLVIKERGKFYNRLIFMEPDGEISFYNKRHLFRMAAEHKTYTAGIKRLLVTWRGWRICPLVCYDLRFPVWSRNNNEYDLLLFVANWPARRIYAWKQLLIARAIENQCYVAGVNRVGVDETGVSYNGESMVLDALGKKISTTKPLQSSVETVRLNGPGLDTFRGQFPVMLDSDQYRILTK